MQFYIRIIIITIKIKKLLIKLKFEMYALKSAWILHRRPIKMGVKCWVGIEIYLN